MRQINLLGKGIKTLSFDSDGIYTTNSENRTHIRFCEISDSEIQSLKNNIQKITLPKIVDGDSLFFDKNAAFPKLMLGRLELDVKRTVKKDKCTKIIINAESIVTKEDLDNLEAGYIIMVGGTDETNFNQVFYVSDLEINRSTQNGIDLDLMQKYFPGRWLKVTVFGDKITDEAIQFISSDPEKITTVQNVAAYLNSKLPTLDDESARTMISLFKANSEEKKLAINMLASFNVSNILFDICEALGNSGTTFDAGTKNSINYKYFKLLLGCSPSEVEDTWRYSSYWSGGKLSACLFNNGMLTPDQKEKAWKKFYRVSIGRDYDGKKLDSYYQGRFDSYNMPYSYDPKRETTVSNSEMERS